MKYAILTLNKKYTYTYFVDRIKSFKIKRGYMQCETHSRTRICMVG